MDQYEERLYQATQQQERVREQEAAAMRWRLEQERREQDARWKVLEAEEAAKRQEEADRIRWQAEQERREQVLRWKAIEAEERAKRQEENYRMRG